jgi:hypothetical protein
LSTQTSTPPHAWLELTESEPFSAPHPLRRKTDCKDVVTLEFREVTRARQHRAAHAYRDHDVGSLRPGLLLDLRA